jgi:hypothetical protein
MTAAKALVDGARRLAVATRPLASAADDIHHVRGQLEQANRQSPIEVLLDSLTTGVARTAPSAERVERTQSRVLPGQRGAISVART